MHDVLSDVLHTVHLQSCIYCQSIINKADWALRFSHIECAAFHIVAEGSCWIEVEGTAQPIQLTKGDLLVLPTGTNHTLADHSGAAICADIRLDQADAHVYQVMRWGDSGPQTSLICGTFTLDKDNGGDLLQFLPTILHFDTSSVARYGIKPSIDALIEEANADYPGRATILTRLADVLFIKVLRACLSMSENQAVGWLRALNDPYLAAAISQLHAKPDHAWTVERLAIAASMSRSAFAVRFVEIVGETPFQYMRRWRMQLASELLRHSSLPITEIASRVGYQSDLTFSKAFRRELQTSPARYRRAARFNLDR